MRLHHLNCISSCPLGGAIMDGHTIGLRARLTNHCFLVETERDGLVLVDTGYGLNDVREPEKRLSKTFLAMMKPDLREEMTAIRQIEALGFDPADVRHVVLTHLDFDHAGGIDDFPQARVHVLHSELDAAKAQRTILDRMRYRPAQWSTHEHWRVYPQGGGEKWFGFDAVRELDGLPPDILMVPLVGHTLGHAGVVVKRDRDWIMNAGDAYFYHREMDPDRPRCTPGLRLYQTMMEKDRKMRLGNQARLRALVKAHRGEVTVVCGHDVTEFVACAGQSTFEPAKPRRRLEGRSQPRLVPINP